MSNDTLWEKMAVQEDEIARLTHDNARLSAANAELAKELDEWKESMEALKHTMIQAAKDGAKIAASLRASEERERGLREEVRVLRSFGNKDCTAMADAHLAALQPAAPGAGEEKS